MKRLILTILISVFTLLTGCNSVKRTVIDSYKYELYIDYKFISFQGKNKTQTLYFSIDSTNGMWYHGKLIIDQKDTVPLNGFEKGQHYVTTYALKDKRTFGRLEIWCRGESGQIIDSLTIEDTESVKIINEKTSLYRKPK